MEKLDLIVHIVNKLIYPEFFERIHEQTKQSGKTNNQRIIHISSTKNKK